MQHPLRREPRAGGEMMRAFSARRLGCKNAARGPQIAAAAAAAAAAARSSAAAPRDPRRLLRHGKSVSPRSTAPHEEARQDGSGLADDEQ